MTRFTNDREQWLQCASEMRAMADWVTDDIARRTMLRIARDFEVLAARTPEGASGQAGTKPDD
jgi:hypothetical protein